MSLATAAVQLRPALAADSEAVASVLIDARAQLMPFAPSAHPEADVRRWVARTLIPSGGVTVATLQGAVVGVLAVQARDGAGWIDQLMVDPAQVRRGIGQRLLRHALAQLPAPMLLYTFQANERARCFYEAQGFVAVAFGDGSGNEERCPDVLYRLDGAR